MSHATHIGWLTHSLALFANEISSYCPTPTAIVVSYESNHCRWLLLLVAAAAAVLQSLELLDAALNTANFQAPPQPTEIRNAHSSIHGKAIQNEFKTNLPVGPAALSGASPMDERREQRSSPPAFEGWGATKKTPRERFWWRHKRPDRNCRGVHENRCCDCNCWQPDASPFQHWKWSVVWATLSCTFWM